MSSWCKQLLLEYQEGERLLKQQLKTLDSDQEADKEDIKIINSMLRDLGFVIKWLDAGVMPETKSIKYTYEDEHVYGVNGYWDDSMGGFITKNNYIDPYKIIEEKIDKELQVKGYEQTFK